MKQPAHGPWVCSVHFLGGSPVSAGAAAVGVVFAPPPTIVIEIIINNTIKPAIFFLINYFPSIALSLSNIL